ncbi:hypothetical protein SODALDRAFT_317855 [Sodiomyces alkalinus F11]|uniref:Ima1 N-terminal domain-containing protein n=1 Tax=Sodiomyces alkalinus (strain CBS 110278 / VKM F-3762 / F11) TaxID=1314773 RepID=A0A3N2PLD1_SODAK|nr:hypothetical protein SODALDRAFT_317855 [Sodiomyces alkalinus F11]ROT35220.1 hypothetical protein SODALDRAFT_317855 [Sodiomyces alkalinus F11]
MARLRPKGNLACFYCGQRSSIKFDRQTRDFLCLHCDAMNYLDENGDITDPPAMQTSRAQVPQYAIPRTQSPEPATESQSVFCATCLKNQHLFTSSLAQYLPDDPDHPDSAQLEKSYYKFRRRLEERYPQICAECEPKVAAKVEEAGYKARTDHLRRMIDRSRQRLSAPKRWTPLDGFDSLGRWLWLTGLASQLLWHLVSVSTLVTTSTPGPLRDPDEDFSRPLLLLRHLTDILPSAPFLATVSIWASIASAWWNPRFVQVFRGFSRHILGLSQWYIFQGLVILVRFIGVRITDIAGGQEVQPSARLGLHFLLALVMVVFYTLARKSVRVDTKPLFQSASPSTTTTPSRSPAPKREAGTPNMSNLLDEILNEDKSPARRSPQETTSPAVLARSAIAQRATNPASEVNLGSLGIREPPPPVHYPEEMEWTPTHSKYRAFNDFGSPSNERKAFGDSPTDPGASPFWYKVPPAPTAPGARLRKAPATVLRRKPVEKEAVFFPANNRPLQSSVSPQQQNDDQGQKVTFSQPSFFATSDHNPNDPRTSLADMLTSSFTLGADDESSDESEKAGRRDDRDIELKIHLPAKRGTARDRLMDTFTLVVLLGVWLHATSDYYSYSRDAMLGSICLSIAVGIRLTGDALAGLGARSGPLAVPVASTAVGIAELGFACHVAVQIWTRGDVRYDADMAFRGLGVMGVMLVHGIWSSIMYL